MNAGDEVHDVEDADDDPIQPDGDEKTREAEMKRNLDNLTICPFLCRSEEHKAGHQPRRIGYEQEVLVLDMPAVDKDIPKSYEDVLKKEIAEEWLKAMQYELSSL